MIMNNTIFTIKPYKDGDYWFFDEPAMGIYRELFVDSASQQISMVAKEKGIKKKKLTISFSEYFFPNADVVLSHLETTEGDGNWYWDAKRKHKSWYCSCLLRFFPHNPPKNIYAMINKP